MPCAPVASVAVGVAVDDALTATAMLGWRLRRLPQFRRERRVGRWGASAESTPQCALLLEAFRPMRVVSASARAQPRPTMSGLLRAPHRRVGVQRASLLPLPEGATCYQRHFRQGLVGECSLCGRPLLCPLLSSKLPRPLSFLRECQCGDSRCGRSDRETCSLSTGPSQWAELAEAGRG